MKDINKLLNDIMDICDKHDPDEVSPVTHDINKVIAEWGMKDTELTKEMLNQPKPIELTKDELDTAIEAVTNWAEANADCYDDEGNETDVDCYDDEGNFTDAIVGTIISKMEQALEDTIE